MIRLVSVNMTNQRDTTSSYTEECCANNANRDNVNSVSWYYLNI